MAQDLLFKIEVDAQYEELVKLQKEIDTLQKQQKEISKQRGKDNKDFQQTTVKLKNLRKEYGQINNSVAENTRQNNKANSTYNKQSQELNKLRKRLKDMLLEEKSSSKETKKLSKRIRELDKRLKDVDAAAGQFQRNVGDYPQTLRLATAEVLKLAGATVALDKSFDSIKEGLQENEEGSEATRKITAGLGNAYEKAKESVSNFALGSVSLAKSLFGDQGIIGASINAREAGERFGKAWKNVTQITKAYEEGVKVEEKLIDQEKLFLELDRAIGMMNASLMVQEAIAGDTTRSFDDMEEAARRALNTELERNELVVQKAQKELEQLRAVIDSKTLEGESERNLLKLREQEVILLNQLDQANAEYITAKINGEKEIAEIQRDRYEQELDFALDVSDRQKSVNERLIANTRIDFETRKELAKKTEDLLDSSYDNQISLTEDYIRERQKMLGKSEEEINERLNFLRLDQLATIEDESVIRTRLIDLGIADQNTQNRIREIIIERKAALQDVSDLYSDLNKEAAEAEAARLQKLEEDTAEIISYYEEQAQQADANVDALMDKEREGREAIKQASIEVAQETADAVFSIQSANVDRRLRYELDQLAVLDERQQDLLQSQLDSGLISQAEYENNRIALAEQTNLERERLEREAFEKKKRLDTAQAIVNGALAITSILATSPDILKPIGPVFLAQVGTAVAATAAQVATIQSQRFERGGLLEGASHDQGGIPAVIDGQRPVELEGGEAIINKKSVAMFKDELSAMNVAGGGVPLFKQGGYVPKFANGGLVRSTATQGQNLNGLSDEIARGIGKIKVVNDPRETIGEFENVASIDNEFTI